MKFYTVVADYISGLWCKNLWKTMHSSWVNGIFVNQNFAAHAALQKECYSKMKIISMNIWNIDQKMHLYNEYTICFGI